MMLVLEHFKSKEVWFMHFILNTHTQRGVWSWLNTPCHSSTLWPDPESGFNLWRQLNEKFDWTICQPPAAAPSTHRVCSLYWHHLFEQLLPSASSVQPQQKSHRKLFHNWNVFHKLKRSAASHRWGLLNEELYTSVATFQNATRCPNGCLHVNFTHI